MKEFINLEENKGEQTIDIKKTYKFVGPNGLDPKNIENEIKEILPSYIPLMDDKEMEELIEYASRLKFDQIKIHLYEQLQMFER